MFDMTNEDKDLQDILHGVEKPMHPDTVHVTLGKPVPKKQSKDVPKEETALDAKWEPAKPNNNWLDKLKGSAIWACGFGSLSFLVFSWQQAGLMDSSIAIPTMCIFTALAGFGVGKNVRCK